MFRKTKVLHFLHPHLRIYAFYTYSDIKTSLGYLDTTLDEQANEWYPTMIYHEKYQQCL